METADEAGSYAGSGLGVLAPADALVNPVIGDTVSFGGNTSPVGGPPLPGGIQALQPPIAMQLAPSQLRYSL